MWKSSKQAIIASGITLVLACLVFVSLGILREVSLRCWKETVPGFQKGVTRLDVPFPADEEAEHARCMGYLSVSPLYQLARLLDSNTSQDGIWHRSKLRQEGQQSPATLNLISYDNNKYRYAFSYPSSLLLYSGFGDAESPGVGPDAESVTVRHWVRGSTLLHVTALAEPLTQETIRSQFGDTPTDEISVGETLAGSAPAYEAKLPEETGIVSRFLFVHSPSGATLKLEVPTNVPEAALILASFKVLQ